MTKQSSNWRVGLALLLALAVTFLNLPVPVAQAQQNPPSNQSFVAGKFVARNYVYPGIRIFSGNNAAGAATITLSQASIRLPDGRSIVPFGGGFNILGQPSASPFSPIQVGAGTTLETVTPTAVSGCFIGAPQGNCAITATFANAHGQGEVVTSGSLGIQEAILDAAFFGSSVNGGGTVVVDPSLAFYGGGVAAVRALLAAATVLPNVSVEDTMAGPPTYWNPGQAVSTILAVPTTLTAQAACDATHSFCSDSTVAGTWTSGTLFGCVAYVDIMGQEGPCSATTSFTTVVSKAVDVGSPAASAGAVGYTIYLSLIGGSYAASYAVPITSSVCTLTTLETTTPACAVANTTYNQVASTLGKNALFSGGAQIPAPTLVTSPGFLLKTVASSTADYVGNPNGRTSYVYAPSSHLGVPGVPGYSLPYTITTAAATATPNVVATVNLPPSFMNFVGKGIRVCGFGSATGTSTATVESFTIWWEASLSNAAGPLPLQIGGPSTTTTLASAIDNYAFCQEITATTTGATGALLPGTGWLTLGDTVNNTHPGAGTNFQVGATGAPNLLNTGGFPTHMHIVYLHTTGTDGTGIIWQKLTIEPL